MTATTLAQSAKVYRTFLSDPVFTQWLEAMATWFNCQEFFDEFKAQVFDIRTAGTYGLDVHGHRLNLTRYVKLADGTTVSLTNDRYRQALISKAMAHNTDCTIPQLNTILRSNISLSNGLAYYKPTGVMSANVVIYNGVNAVDQALMLATMPNPQGVKITINVIPSKVFGFKQQTPSSIIEPWNSAPFYTRPTS